jgi:hypothetical protein
MLSFKTGDNLQIVNLSPLEETRPRRSEDCIGDSGQPMPLAVIAVSMLVMLVVVRPSDASPSCMSKTEARQHFRSTHIYWHGRNHCWDATPIRRLTQNHKAQRDRRVNEVPRTIDRPKWQESMSRMVSDNEPVQKAPQTPWTSRWTDIEPSIPSLDARWVDIVQTRSPSIIEPKSEPMVSPQFILLAFIIIAIGLTLATIELLFRRTVY